MSVHKFYLAALVGMTCLVQPLQQIIHFLQDIGGQHLAMSAQVVWVSIFVLHNAIYLGIKK